VSAKPRRQPCDYLVYAIRGFKALLARFLSHDLDTRVPLTAALGPNQRWSMDFVHDALVDGRVRILAVVDDYTRENLCLVADTSFPGGRVIRELEAALRVRGAGRPRAK
jgi:transposase InsO family protein